MNDSVRRIVRQSACLSVPVETVGRTDDLYACGLSSLGAVRLMTALEEHFEVEIPAELLNRELFRTLESIEAVLERLLAQASGLTRA